MVKGIGDQSQGATMILSDIGFEVTRDALGKFREALAAVQSEEAGADADQAWLYQVQIDAIKSQIETLEDELSHYELLKAGTTTFGEVQSLEDLSLALVESRIACGMSQNELAKRLGMELLQVQRFEDSEYFGASTEQLIKACEVLDVHAPGLFENSDGYKVSETS